MPPFGTADRHLEKKNHPVALSSDVEPDAALTAAPGAAPDPPAEPTAAVPTAAVPTAAVPDDQVRDDQVRDDQVRDAVRRGFLHLARIQKPAGCVVGEVQWSPILTAQYVMTAAMTDQEIPAERKARFVQYFEVWQNGDGGWGMHAESPSYVYITTLVYVALRALDLPADHPLCARGRQWLRAQGGVLQIPSWGKAWLAMFNLYDWRAVPPTLPELWLLPESLPVHPRRMYCHTRLIYLGLSYLYGVRYRGPVTPLVHELRHELYDQATGTPYDRVRFTRHRFDLAPTDLFEAPPLAMKAAYVVSGLYDKVRLRSLRRRSLSYCLDQIVEHQRESRYAAISPVNGLLNCLALHHAGHPDFQPSFEGVDYWAWVDEAEGERFNGAHSHSWDTGFAVQALCEGPLADEFDTFCERAARYLVASQQTQEVPERQRYQRDTRVGGWCFSDEHHRWPVSDCTAEVLSGLRYLADRLPAEQLPSPERLVQAALFILTRQNPDGGWGSYERNRGGDVLKRLNPSEMFGNCMVEYSYVECTASCMQALRHTLDRFADLFSERERARMERSIAKGAKLLRRTQETAGGWQGFWGVNYTYGTLFGITGLLAAGAPRTDPAIVKACQWLLDHQHPAGGWGESWRGCHEERYVPHTEPQVIMTAWAVMALLRAGYDGPGARQALDTGVQLLVDRQLEDGDWPKQGVGGVFFNTAFHHYMLYKNYFPLWALGLYLGRAPRDAS